MQESEAQEIINKLIAQAEENDHIKVKLITSWDEYRFYIKQERALKVVIRVLRDCIYFVFRSYRKGVAAGTADFNELLAYRKLKEVQEFYKQELCTVQEMNTEYDNYLGDWTNFFKAILGYERED